eukprot:2433649-Rhodomonas_salina.1
MQCVPDVWNLDVAGRGMRGKMRGSGGQSWSNAASTSDARSLLSLRTDARPTPILQTGCRVLRIPDDSMIRACRSPPLHCASSHAVCGAPSRRVLVTAPRVRVRACCGWLRALISGVSGSRILLLLDNAAASPLPTIGPGLGRLGPDWVDWDHDGLQVEEAHNLHEFTATRVKLHGSEAEALQLEACFLMMMMMMSMMMM